MMFKVVRLCSLCLVLTLAAGWYAFGKSTQLVSPPLRIPIEKGVSLSGSYHVTLTPEFVEAAQAEACFPCHKDYPHKQNTFSRAFLNLHARRLDCLVCHLEKEQRRRVKLGWFELLPTGLSESSVESADAFIAPYFPTSGPHEVYESRSGQEMLAISAEGKHLAHVDSLRCSACHSASGPSILRGMGYEGDALDRLENLEYIAKFDEGKEFYYTRF